MNNRLIIRLLGVCLVLQTTAPSVAQGLCGPGQFALKSSEPGKLRDWVSDYDKLAKSRMKISPLRRYFYVGDKKRDCITLTELQALAKAIQQIKTENVTGAKEFVSAIVAVTPKDKPAQKPATSDSTRPPTAPAVLAADTAGIAEPTDAEQLTLLYAEQEKLKEDRDFWQLLTFVLAGLAALLGGLVLWLNSRANRKLAKQQKDHSDKTQKTKSGHDAQIADLKKKLEELTGTPVTEQQHNTGRANTRNPDKTPPVTPVVAELPTVDLTPLIPIVEPEPVAPIPLAVAPFFLSMPTATDGVATFLDRRQAQFNPSSSVYRFQLTGSAGNQAKFWFIDESGPVEGALTYPDTYLQPACEYKGLNTKAKRIITDTPGLAVLTGDFWRVERKAIIRFA